MTLKGEQCKLTAKEGERFCWRHLTKCLKEVVNAKDGKKASVPFPLMKQITETIVEKVNSGKTATKATQETLDSLVEELGFLDVSDLVDLTEDEIDYLIAITQLHEDKESLRDIVQKKIDEGFIRDPHAKLMLKTRELLNELAGKFCRCIKKVMDADIKAGNEGNESKAIAICRKGVINNKGITFPRFNCTDNSTFLPSKDNKKLLKKHPGYEEFLQNVSDGNLEKWNKLSKVEKDKYFMKAK